MERRPVLWADDGLWDNARLRGGAPRVAEQGYTYGESVDGMFCREVLEKDAGEHSLFEVEYRGLG